MKNNSFERMPVSVNPQFEQIIDDLAKQHYTVIDGFFSADETVALRTSLGEKYKADQFKKSGIGNRVNEQIKKAVRGDFILWIDEAGANQAERMFFEKIDTLVDYLNCTCFMGILHKEFHYAVYPKGRFYKRHLDTFQNDGRRKLSVVCYLNAADWQPDNGGELVLYVPENGKEIEKRLVPFPGRVVIFESQVLEHEVKAAKFSERLSITGWLKTR